uniref:Alpha/beta hydrolase fold-3 domain-containing protein n=1 Tax=Cannabis sativa TaxID=3483 RepID=A0A803QQE4_CANSA
MGAVVLNQSVHINPSKGPQKLINNDVIEEIGGLIKVYKDGKVERPEVVPCVTASLADHDQLGSAAVISTDVVIDKSTNVWARFYVPILAQKDKIPLIVYFHGGGFCVGSAAWSCYHDFLSKLSAELSCLIMSVNYRLAPENPLPAAYEDGFKALSWLKRQAVARNDSVLARCDFSKIFLVGDSAGANIAYNLTTRLINSAEAKRLKPLSFKGSVLVQPFFGGESRTESEKLSAAAGRRSALSLAASDTYWRLALPGGATRDHPWCNPLGKGSVIEKACNDDDEVLGMMVCVSEDDILKDRNLEFCGALGKKMKVDYVVYGGVGHAFQILNKSQLSQIRTQEMMTHIKAFINKY